MNGKKKESKDKHDDHGIKDAQGLGDQRLLFYPILLLHSHRHLFLLVRVEYTSFELVLVYYQKLIEKKGKEDPQKPINSKKKKKRTHEIPNEQQLSEVVERDLSQQTPKRDIF